MDTREEIINLVKTNKPIFVAFSGGYDSTYLLNTVLEHISYYGSRSPVTAMSLVFKEGLTYYPNQREEVEARAKILTYLRKKFSSITLYDVTINVGCDASEDYMSNIKQDIQQEFGFPLQFLHLSYLYSHIPSDSIVMFGWIRNDREALHIEHFKSYYNSLNHILHKDIVFATPLIERRKDDILSWFLTENKELFDMCVTCANLGKYTCDCPCCIDLKGALFGAYLLGCKEAEEAFFKLYKEPLNSIL